MKLTVLGRYGPFPAPSGACSSYLIEAPMRAEENKPGDPKVRIVLDLGAGTLSRLLSVCPLTGIDAIFLSHLHSDHMSDMLILRYALQQLRARGEAVPLTVVAPAEPTAEFRMLEAAGTFRMVKAEDYLCLRVGTLAVTLHRMVHPVPSYAMNIVEEKEHSRQARLFYTGDTGMHEHIAPHCAGADVLLADTGLLTRENPAETAPHLTAGEAGKLARDAGVKRLLCTHLWGGGVLEDELQKEAQRYFLQTEIAQEMQTYEI